MPALAPLRSSPCLFCAFAATASRRALSARLLPMTQVACRSDSSPRSQTKAKSLRHTINPLYSAVGPSYGAFFAEVRGQMADLRSQFMQPEFLESLQLDHDGFEREWELFERTVSLFIKQASPELISLARGAGPRNMARTGRDINKRLRYMFYTQAVGGRFTEAERGNQKKVADLRYPAEWYPATRELARTVHLHVGPTNSGKTYHALKRLEESKRGIYLGPLRLLAHEVYTRLNAKGKACALVTGEEQRVPDGDVNMWSCTVEMAPLNTRLDVAVIDEIQMINHPERGWAWTSAFLGVQAQEVHLCGEARTVPLIRELCALIGDKVIVHEYERLTPLEVAKSSLKGNLNNLEKGDCIVAFSVLGLHALRRAVETKTGKKCAIVYGGLPPETRAQQARLFNDPDNDYDFLVASDAVGMGLNLSIKRVIFEAITKSNGSKEVPLMISEVKQIGGRAGRYRSAHQAITADTKVDSGSTDDKAVALDDAMPEAAKKWKPEPQPPGMVTTLDAMDFPYLKATMEREPEPIETAGLFPPSLIIERFASYFPPGTPFSYIMLRLNEISVIHPRFHLCDLRDQLAIADEIHLVQNLSIQDRITICAAPANMREPSERNFLRTLAKCIADNTSGNLLDLPGLPLEILDEKPSSDRKYLSQLERLHKMIVTYLWLSYRFPHVFTSRSLASHVKLLTEEAIENQLMEFSWSDAAMTKRREKRSKAFSDLVASHESTSSGSIINTKRTGFRSIILDRQPLSEPGPSDEEGSSRAEELRRSVG